MVQRNFSVQTSIDVIFPHDEDFYGVEDPYKWMYTDGNYSLRQGDDFSFFNRVQPRVYAGHYFFVSRGKKARDTALEMLDWMFENTDAEVIRGMTPLVLRNARWMSRQLGFRSCGVVTYDRGPCELFLLYKADHIKRRENWLPQQL